MPPKTTTASNPRPRKSTSRSGVPPQTGTTPNSYDALVEQFKDVDYSPAQPRPATRKAVAPSVHGNAEALSRVAQGEHNKLMLQTETAINLAIGYTLTKQGDKFIRITPAALKKFSDEYRVTQKMDADGTVEITVKPRAKS